MAISTPSTLDSGAGRALAALRGFALAEPDVERCSLCSATLPDDHDHLIDIGTRAIVCSCVACAILFSSRAKTAYKRIPRDVTLLPGFPVGDGRWDMLGIPIGLAFFSRGSADGRITAVYPSPAGPMRSLLDLSAWQGIMLDTPAIASMDDDVEALLINRTGDADMVYIAPIDECYRLVGLVRSHWQGLSGGVAVHAAISEFFESLRTRARTLSEVGNA